MTQEMNTGQITITTMTIEDTAMMTDGITIPDATAGMMTITGTTGIGTIAITTTTATMIKDKSPFLF
jgi:hypothetical protein